MNRAILLIIGTILWVPTLAENKSSDSGNFFVDSLSEGNVQIHLQSEHGDGCETCNETHLGIGWTGADRISPTFGYYPNSYNDDSVYGGVHVDLAWGISTSVVGITGYTDHLDTEFLFGELVVAPLIHYKFDAEISPLLTWVPASGGGVALLSINYRY